MKRPNSILYTVLVASLLATIYGVSASCSATTKDKTSVNTNELETQILAELNYEDAIRQLSSIPYDQSFNQALYNATERMAQIENDGAYSYPELFISEYRTIQPDVDFSLVFDFIDKSDNDVAVAEKIRKKILDEVLPQTINILKKRMDNAGSRVAIENVDNKGAQININMYSASDTIRLKHLLEQKGDLEFFTTYRLSDLDYAFTNGQMEVQNNDSDMIVLAEMLSNNPMRSDSYCILGYAATPVQIKAIDRAISRPEIKALLPDDFILSWSHTPVTIPTNTNDEATLGYTAYALRKDAKSSIQSGAVLNGAVITDANAHEYTYGGYEIKITMNSDGAKLWADITKNNITKAIAVLIDGKVYMAPHVNEPILGGHTSITGNFTEDEATDIANILKAGKSNVALKIIEIRQ